MESDAVNCSKCGFGFSFAKIVGPIYDKCYFHPTEQYWARRTQIEKSDDRLKNYRVESAHSTNGFYIDYDKLEDEDPELFKEYQPMLEELYEREELEVSFLTNGRLLLSKGECPHCGSEGALEFKTK